MREIVLDTETTGLDPMKGDRLVEIGCVEIINRFLTGRVFHRYVNPERAMPPDAFAVHGLSDAFLSDKPVFKEISEEFLAFIGEDTLVAHNASFDMNFLNHELKRLGKGPIAPTRVIDTLTIARRRHPGQQNSLDALCARYGIDASRRTRHGALLDAEILAEVYAELSGGRQSSLGLDEFGRATPGMPGTLTVTRTDPAAREVREQPRISAAEIGKHRAFIAEMGEKALWNAYLTSASTPQEQE